MSSKITIMGIPRTAFATSQASQSQSRCTCQSRATCVTHPATCSRTWWFAAVTSNPLQLLFWKPHSSWSPTQMHRPSNRQTKTAVGDLCASSSSSVTTQVRSVIHSPVPHSDIAPCKQLVWEPSHGLLAIRSIDHLPSLSLELSGVVIKH